MLGVGRVDAPGVWGEKVVCGAASAPELSGLGQGATADSLGEDVLQCLNNHIHHLRVGRGNTDKDKDKDSSVNKASSRWTAHKNLKSSISRRAILIIIIILFLHALIFYSTPHPDSENHQSL